MVRQVFVLLAVFPLFSHALLGITQSAGVEGTLMCGSVPAANVTVKLYDDDSGVDTDDLMAEGSSNKNGYFKLVGSTDEYMTIDAKLNIYHDCDDGNTPCQRKLTFWIPDEYISTGTLPSRIYNMGVINLVVKYDGEERDCMH